MTVQSGPHKYPVLKTPEGEAATFLVFSRKLKMIITIIKVN